MTVSNAVMRRAYVLHGAGDGAVEPVALAVAGAGDAVVEVSRVGLCGTDAEFYRGTQPYLFDGGAAYPLRLGHEWAGRVTSGGADVPPDLVGRRVTGDTMLGCHHCDLCARGRQHLCRDRSEIGVLRGRPGALADELVVPVSTLHVLPDAIDDAVGALVEPASLALRCVRSLGAEPGDLVLVRGLGAIGLLVVAFGTQAGLQMHAVGRRQNSLRLAESLGAVGAWTAESLPAGLKFEAAVGASPDPAVPAQCLRRLLPGGSLVLVGISGSPSLLEARELVVGDHRVLGLLSGSPVFADTIDALAAAPFDPHTLIGGVFPLEETSDVLAGRAGGPETAPKLQIELRTS